MISQPSLTLLRNHIDISQVPFSDRGSRLLVYKELDTHRLFIKLAERLTSISPDIEAYLRRPPFINHLCFVDEHGEGLEFETITYPHIIIFKTRIGEFKLAFQDERTLAFGIPDGTTCGIQFRVSPEFWEISQHGGLFRSVRNLTYTSSAQIVSNLIVPGDEGYQVEIIVRSEQDQIINIAIHHAGMVGTEGLMPFSSVLQMAEKRWQSWFNQVPPVDDRYLRAYSYAWWVMGNNLISPLGNILYESMAPSKMNYVGLWLWDSALHALAFRYMDPDLARNQIRSMLAHQRPNGMLPDAVFDEGLVFSIDHPIVGEVTKPPILAWAALKLHETDPDPVFLKEIYPALVHLSAWWFSMNDDDNDGIVQYNHPYSSGLDDSPLWDYGMPVESPDINTHLCIQMEALSKMAEILGMPQEAAMWQRRRSSLVRRMIKDMWDPDAGMFWVLKDEVPVQVATPFNLFPIWTGLLPEEINQRLIDHLIDPNMFGGEYAIPTVARNDPHYDPTTMWRGPIWANINYFFIEALEKIGQFDLAQQLSRKTLDLIAGNDGIFEFYNAENGKPPDKAANIFGWTAAVFIDLAVKASQEQIYREEDGRTLQAF